jgi:hypothetical protein
VTASVSLSRAYPNTIEKSLGYRSLSSAFSVTIGSIEESAVAISNNCQLFSTIDSCASDTDTKSPK